VSVGAFVMPNDQIQPDMPLTAFSVPLEMLENVAGAVFTSLTTCPCLLQHFCLLCLPQGIGLFLDQQAFANSLSQRACLSCCSV